MPAPINSKIFVKEFNRLIALNASKALQLVTGMFVGLAVEYTRSQGHDPDCNLQIKCLGRRSITIHKISTPFVEAAPKTNPTLELCKLAEPHLIDGQRLFASKSIVVAINDSQPLADRLADIDLLIKLLGVLRGKLI